MFDGIKMMPGVIAMLRTTFVSLIAVLISEINFVGLSCMQNSIFDEPMKYLLCL